MVKRFKNKLCQSATYVISIGIEGGVVHVHRMAEDLQGNLFENGKNKVFLAHLVFRCNLVAKSVVLALKGQGKGGVVSALKRLKGSAQKKVARETSTINKGDCSLELVKPITWQ